FPAELVVLCYRVIAIGQRDVGTALGGGEHGLAILSTPGRDHLAMNVSVQPRAREGKVADGDAVFIELVNLAMELAAVGTVDVGEHGQRRLRLPLGGE